MIDINWVGRNLFLLGNFVFIGIVLVMVYRGRISSRTAFFNILIALCLMVFSHLVWSQLLASDFVLSTYRSFMKANPIQWPVGIYLGVLCFLLADFVFFLSHYLQHRFLWPIHAIHHSPTDVDYSVHFRQSCWNRGISLILIFALCCLLRLNIWVVLFYNGVVNLYQFFMHAREQKWPTFLRLLLVIPQDHRIHHRLGETHKNFGGVLNIWDRLFRTLEYSNPNQKVEYGILEKHNFHQPWSWFYSKIEKRD